MDSELKETMQEILAQLKEINQNLKELQGQSRFHSVSDIYNKLDAIQGSSGNSLSDLWDKLDMIEYDR